MTNSNLPKHEITLIADDIREEKGNKISLIGIYGDDIICESLPAMLSKLCFCTIISGGKGEHILRLSLKDPNGKELLIAKNEIAITLKEGLGHINNCISPFPASKEGSYTYSISIDGNEFCRAVFTIKKGKVS